MKRKDLHPFQIAAFLHYGLSSVVMFNDGAGRLGRLFANIYLMQKGYQPFYVPVDKEYTKLFYAENHDVAFCKYLTTTLEGIQQSEDEDSENVVDEQVPECKIS